MPATIPLEISAGPIGFRLLIVELETVGINGFAVIRNGLGKGDRKVSSRDSLAREVEDLTIITTIPADRPQSVVDATRPLLETFGGYCLVSAAMWVLH